LAREGCGCCGRRQPRHRLLQPTRLEQRRPLHSPPSPKGAGRAQAPAFAPCIEGGRRAQRGGGICSSLRSACAAQIPHGRYAAVAPFFKGGWNSAGRWFRPLHREGAGTAQAAAFAPFTEGGRRAQRGGGICFSPRSLRAALIPHVRCAAVAPFSKGGWNSAGRWFRPLHRRGCKSADRWFCPLHRRGPTRAARRGDVLFAGCPSAAQIPRDRCVAVDLSFQRAPESHGLASASWPRIRATGQASKAAVAHLLDKARRPRTSGIAERWGNARSPSHPYRVSNHQSRPPATVRRRAASRFAFS
jgi:hypothetical protein